MLKFLLETGTSIEPLFWVIIHVSIPQGLLDHNWEGLQDTAESTARTRDPLITWQYGFCNFHKGDQPLVSSKALCCGCQISLMDGKYKQVLSYYCDFDSTACTHINFIFYKQHICEFYLASGSLIFICSLFFLLLMVPFPLYVFQSQICMTWYLSCFNLFYLYCLIFLTILFFRIDF